jgi:hypothetical protein
MKNNICYGVWYPFALINMPYRYSSNKKGKKKAVLSLFFYNKTLLYLSIALWLFTEFLHIKEINKEKSDIFDEHHEIQNKIKSVRNTVNLLNNFTKISGLKVNNNKSELAPLGRSRMEIYTHNFSPGMKITVEKR